MHKLALSLAALVMGVSLVHRSPDSALPIQGLWSLYESKREGDPLRFYYFHDGGIGLYRYGKVGLNNTNSFDYQVDGRLLELTFRKTGQRWAVHFRIEPDPQDENREWLVLEHDPRETEETRYFRKKSALAQEEDFGRMWIDEEHFATGGMGFRIYQFKDPMVGGRGVGWYHQGDYDDWSTESLQYRLEDGDIHLRFPIRQEEASTPFSIRETFGRTLTLYEDPRNFWQSGQFEDRGRSFGLFQQLP